MRIVNLTPHNVRVVQGRLALDFPPSGRVARVGETVDRVGALSLCSCPPGPEGEGPCCEFCGTPPVETFAATRGAIEGLPAPVAGAVYLVSAMVADAVRRPDVVSPHGLVRDSGGQPTGCTGFRVWA